MPVPLRALTGMEFYLFMVAELISRIPVHIREKGTLILDEVGSAEVALTKLKKMLKAHEIRHEFSRIFFRRSRSEDLIQVADLVRAQSCAVIQRMTMKPSNTSKIKCRLYLSTTVKATHPASLVHQHRWGQVVTIDNFLRGGRSLSAFLFLLYRFSRLPSR